jgi:hypothetical protein
MTRNGTAYRLPPSVPRTSATASGSWHTPVASDADGKPRWDHRASPGHVRKKPVPNLMAQIMERIPTPTAGDAKSSGSRNTPESKAHPGVSLTDYVREDGGTGRWPTPTARDHKDTGDSVSLGTVPVNGLLGRAVEPSKTNGSLNPTWVEWLMGFPLGWTVCEPSATRSSRKSSKRSAGASSTE